MFSLMKVIQQLLYQRQKDLDYRSSVIDKIAKMESDYTLQSERIKKLKEENDTNNKENGLQLNQWKLLEKKIKQEKDKLLLEKDELNKSLSKAL